MSNLVTMQTDFNSDTNVLFISEHSAANTRCPDLVVFVAVDLTDFPLGIITLIILIFFCLHRMLVAHT